MSTSSDNALEQLKQRTAEIHESLEDHRLLRKMMRKELNREEYAEFLKQNYIAYRQIEAAFTESEIHQLYPDHMISGWVEADLSALGNSIPSNQNVIALSSLEEQLGALYVILGSMMGGAMIAKVLLDNDQLELDQQQFYSPDAHRRMHYWRDFKDYINKQDFNQDQIDQMVSGAHKAFGAFENQYRNHL